METIKDLIRELHRRALWQVLVIFLGGSWLVLQVVGVLTEKVGLPEWTPRIALLLLLIGLPFTLAAAFVREGTPGHESALGGVLQELHRRSLWQVLGLFLAGSWGALQVVEVLTQAAGLPDWTPTMALVLLLIGLPFCLATAFVQEGMPGREGVDPQGGETMATSGSGVRVSASTDSPERPTVTSKTRGLLTWRRALQGGMGAFALLGFSLAAYFVMWTTGIGPVGNLVAQGAITEGERVILADFADATGEGVGDAVTEALRVDLLEASILDLVEREEIASTLRLMQVEAGAALTAERARDVARREGIAAVIDGEVTTVGTGYLMIATLRVADGGQTLASVRVTADGPGEVIASIDLLSQKLREKSGESLRTIRAGKPLEQVTTASLQALRLYTEATRLSYSGTGEGRPRQLVRQALELDPTFAMAWRFLGVLSGGDPAQRAEATSNAFRFRDRLSELERYFVEALYFSHIVVDHPKVIRAYENILAIDPMERRALNNLSSPYRRRGDLQGAERLLRRAVDSPGRTILNYDLLFATLVDMGRVEEAVELLGEWADTIGLHPLLTLAQAEAAFAQGGVTRAEAIAQAQSDDPSISPGGRGRAISALARYAYWAGRLDEGRRLYLMAEAGAGDARRTWEARSDAAYEEALVGQAPWARSHLRETLSAVAPSLPFSEGFRPLAAMLFASAGDPEGVDLIIRAWESGKPENLRGPTEVAWVRLARLRAEAARGDTVGAANALSRLLVEAGCSEACYPFFQATLYDHIGDHRRATELYERVLRPGYNGWGLNTGERLHAMMRLGPLYDELDDTTKAIEAYQRMVDQWADADARGQETVGRFRVRIAALGG